MFNKVTFDNLNLLQIIPPSIKTSNIRILISEEFGDVIELSYKRLAVMAQPPSRVERTRR